MQGVRPLNWREGGMERKGETAGERERKKFSLHVEIQHIFYRVTFSPNQRESLYF
jgi:hypothetical protein